MKNETILSISSLTVKFGGLVALDDVHLEVKPNTVVGLIGPNGAGKTTLFNSISGLVQPTAGQISIGGKNVAWPKPHELPSYEIARTLQGVGLFTGLSVIENVMMGADHLRTSNFAQDLFGLSTKAEKALRRRAMDALAWAGALAFADLQPGQLTYPDTKRVALARALVSEPKLILLDEPAAGLGQDDIDRLAKLIKDLTRRCAVLIVEHHVDFVSEISDHVYVLDFGEVISSGTFDTVKRDPAVLAAYLGTNSLSGVDELGSSH